MPQVVNGQVYTNISDLPEIDEITVGNKLIVETENGTNIIDFENLILTKDNVTFGATIDANTSNIATLSSSQATLSNTVTTQASFQNAYVTFKYRLNAGAAGFTFSTEEVQLPISRIQANTIDYNLTNVSSTKTSLASNIMSLNPGTYQVNIQATVSGSAFLELYNSSNSTVLMTSDYSQAPYMQGQIALSVRSDLYIRGSANASRTLGVSMPFTGKVQVPLVATFQLLSSGTFATN